MESPVPDVNQRRSSTDHRSATHEVLAHLLSLCLPAGAGAVQALRHLHPLIKWERARFFFGSFSQVQHMKSTLFDTLFDSLTAEDLRGKSKVMESLETLKDQAHQIQALRPGPAFSMANQQRRSQPRAAGACGSQATNCVDPADL